MSSKLTLYIDDDLIAHVKLYAKEQHLSVSKVVNNFLTILKQETPRKKDSAPITRSLKGILSDTAIDTEDYHKYLENKYL